MTHEIYTIFNPILAREARDLSNIVPSARIIPVGDFPEDVAIHEDGSTEYDPRKPLAYFAIELRSKRAVKAWTGIVRRLDSARVNLSDPRKALGSTDQ